MTYMSHRVALFYECTFPVIVSCMNLWCVGCIDKEEKNLVVYSIETIRGCLFLITIISKCITDILPQTKFVVHFSNLKKDL